MAKERVKATRSRQETGWLVSCEDNPTPLAVTELFVSAIQAKNTQEAVALWKKANRISHAAGHVRVIEAAGDSTGTTQPEEESASRG